MVLKQIIDKVKFIKKILTIFLFRFDGSSAHETKYSDGLPCTFEAHMRRTFLQRDKGEVWISASSLIESS